MKKLFVLLLTVVSVAITSCSMFQKPDLPIIEEVENYPVYSIGEILEQRKAEINAAKIDSIYYSIPDLILVQILKQTGTDVYRDLVVDLYLQDRMYYEGYEKGVKEGCNQEIYYKEDTIPIITKTLIEPSPIDNSLR